MSINEIFYYPYAYPAGRGQAPLLQAVALYFDRVYVLDPEKAVAGQIGLYGDAAKDVLLLEQEGILARVRPEEMLASYGEEIVQAVREDLDDPEYRRLCATQTSRDSWLLALAKIPMKVSEDEALRKLITFPSPTGEPVQIDGPDPQGDQYYETGAVGQRLANGEIVGGERAEFRYRSLPLALGESIMLNHALFGSLLYKQTTPFTDDRFHYRVLQHKIERARGIPEIRATLENVARQRQMKADVFAATALSDSMLGLPTVSPDLPLETLLSYRKDHSDQLGHARKELAWLAREIRDTPWSDEFAKEVEVKTIPALRRQLQESRKARDAWLKSGRGRLALRGTGVAAAAAAGTLSLVFAPTPLLPLQVVVGALGLVSGAVPGLELLWERLEARKRGEQNGLHYLLGVGGGKT